METIKSTINDQDLPMHLWVEATRTTFYVQNIISQSSLRNKIPKEMFTNENPEVSHLKLFGCHVYLHVPKNKISKLDPSRKTRIFVGYNH